MSATTAVLRLIRQQEVAGKKVEAVTVSAPLWDRLAAEFAEVALYPNSEPVDGLFLHGVRINRAA